MVIGIDWTLLNSNFLFLVVPVIKDKPKIIKIIKKRTVIIECTVASKFEPKCTWVKEENEITESIKHVYLVEQKQEGEFIVKLEINNIEASDKGAYKLIARNEKGEAISQIVNLIDIPEEEAKPTKPEIFQRLVESKKVAEDSTFELMIILTRIDKKVKVTWYKDTTVVRETKEITTTFDGKTARLTFSSARMEHTAVYRVVVSNEIGQDECSGKIIVCHVDERTKQFEEEKKKEKAKREEEEKRKVILLICVIYVSINVVLLYVTCLK